MEETSLLKMLDLGKNHVPCDVRGLQKDQGPSLSLFLHTVQMCFHGMLLMDS